jgi:hypothetical protein
MNIYKATIYGDKYPTDYQVEASNWATASARSVREWQKRFKGNRAKQIKIIITKP